MQPWKHFPVHNHSSSTVEWQVAFCNSTPRAPAQKRGVDGVTLFLGGKARIDSAQLPTLLSLLLLLLLSAIFQKFVSLGLSLPSSRNRPCCCCCRQSSSPPLPTAAAFPNPNTLAAAASPPPLIGGGPPPLIARSHPNFVSAARGGEGTRVGI